MTFNARIFKNPVFLELSRTYISDYHVFVTFNNNQHVKKKIEQDFKTSKYLFLLIKLGMGVEPTTCWLRSILRRRPGFLSCSPVFDIVGKFPVLGDGVFSLVLPCLVHKKCTIGLDGLVFIARWKAVLILYPP